MYLGCKPERDEGEFLKVRESVVRPNKVFRFGQTQRIVPIRFRDKAGHDRRGLRNVIDHFADDGVVLNVDLAVKVVR